MAQALLTAVALATIGQGATAVLGLLGTDLSRHITFGIFSTMITMLAHSMMMFYLIGKGKAVKDAMAEGGLTGDYFRRSRQRAAGVLRRDGRDAMTCDATAAQRRTGVCRRSSTGCLLRCGPRQPRRAKIEIDALGELRGDRVVVRSTGCSFGAPSLELAHLVKAIAPEAGAIEVRPLVSIRPRSSGSTSRRETRSPDHGAALPTREKFACSAAVPQTSPTSRLLAFVDRFGIVHSKRGPLEACRPAEPRGRFPSICAAAEISYSKATAWPRVACRADWDRMAGSLDASTCRAMGRACTGAGPVSNMRQWWSGRVVALAPMFAARRPPQHRHLAFGADPSSLVRLPICAALDRQGRLSPRRDEVYVHVSAKEIRA